MGFSAVQLFDALKPEITALQASRSEKLKPNVHVKITDLASFVETFLYFFQMGSNAEFTSINRELFLLFHDRLHEAKIEINEEVGGHSSVWAIRA